MSVSLKACASQKSKVETGRGGGGGADSPGTLASGPRLYSELWTHGVDRMEGEWEWTVGPRALTFMSRGCPGKVWGQVIENQP